MSGTRSASQLASLIDLVLSRLGISIQERERERDERTLETRLDSDCKRRVDYTFITRCAIPLRYAASFKREFIVLFHLSILALDYLTWHAIKENPSRRRLVGGELINVLPGERPITGGIELVCQQVIAFNESAAVRSARTRNYLP